MIKNVVLDLINYYKKAIIVFFIIFAFFISPYNILLKLNPTDWINTNFYERIIMSLGYGFIFNAIPIVWGVLIYFPLWYLLGRKRKTEYKVELIYIIIFSSAFFHLMILFMLYQKEILSLKTLLAL